MSESYSSCYYVLMRAVSLIAAVMILVVYANPISASRDTRADIFELRTSLN